MRALEEVLLGIERDDLKTVWRLLKENPHLFHFKIEHGWPILHRCLDKRCIDVKLIKLFIESGGDVNRRTDSGVSLASLAATMYDGKEIQSYLTECGARMSKFEEVEVAFKVGLENDQAQAILEKLVGEHPDLVLEVGYEGFTLLHHAVLHSHCHAVPFLLDRGAHPNAITYAGETPLDLCGGDEDGLACAELLISKGAKHSAMGEIVVMIREGRDDEIIKRLEAEPRLWNVWHPRGPLLHLAAWLGRGTRLMNYLLKKGVHPNVPNEQGETALHRGIERGNLGLDRIRVLLEYGADVSRSDNRSYTPLHVAVFNYAVEAVVMLVENGAAINAKTNDGETPLDFVNQLRFPGYRQLADYLKSKGACSGKPKRNKARL